MTFDVPTIRKRETFGDSDGNWNVSVNANRGTPLESVSTFCPNAVVLPNDSPWNSILFKTET